MRSLLSLLTIGAMLALAAETQAQVGGVAAGGGGAAGAVGGMAGGGIGGNGMVGSGMANGSLIGGNQAAASPGGQLGGGGTAGANLAGAPNMGMGANMAGRGSTMQQGMPGTAIGGNYMGSNGNNLAFRRGNNLGVAAQGAGGLSGRGMFSGRNGLQNNMFRLPTGGFSAWGRGGWGGGNFGYGNYQGPGGFGFGSAFPGYTGSPMFGRTAQQQMYYNAIGRGGLY